MFEDVLIESAKQKGRGRKALSLPVSLALHLVVIGLAVGASIWFVEDVPEPPIPVTFYAAAPPPPPPPPAAAPKPAASKPEAPKQLPVKPSEMTAPTVIPEKIPEPLAAPEPEAPATEGVEGGVEGGVPGGVMGGVLGGVVGGTGPGTGDEPLRVGGDVKAPQLVNRVEPSYPEAARKARMEGVVILEAIITASGNVEDVKVLKSVNPLLDAAATRAVSQWRYRPATLNGRAVRVYLTVTVTFNLH
ncbi:MAG TPA: TonB family protein [Thermoanaerobaculia bacterium]|nr:TonB family protein [Thermoanaerobaculia bacterium]